MTGKEKSSKAFLLELAGSASPDLNAALNEFVRSPEKTTDTARSLGDRALFAINLQSFQTAEFHPPAQIDRGPYGEGEGVVLGRYKQGLYNISNHKLKVSSQPEKSGVEDDGSVWLSLEPSIMDRDVIVRPPLFPADLEPSEADLRFRMLIPERFRLGIPESKMALNGLLMKLAADEAQQKLPRDDKVRHFGRKLYLQRLVVNQKLLPNSPTPANQNPVPKAA